ncbi:MAG: hypothetical protein RL141_702 [Candidatus Parcubacteria bacterium]|jgi:hypothetical protein
MTQNKRWLYGGSGLVVLLAIFLIIMNFNKEDHDGALTPSRQRDMSRQLPAQRVLTPPESTKDWKTYTSEAYGFSIQYPPELSVEAREGSSDFDKRFLTLDIGTPQDLKDLYAPTETEGSPLFLRISASVPNETVDHGGRMTPEICGSDDWFSQYLLIDGLRIPTCQDMTLKMFPSLFAVFRKTDQDPMIYVIDSMQYEGADKIMIEQILSTLKFSK